MKVDRHQPLGRTLAALWATLAVACGDGSTGMSSVGSGETLLVEGTGLVVSSVNGVAITQAEVAKVVRHTALSPVETLRRLQARALLAGEAAQRGYGSARDVRKAVRQALVQQVLAAEDATIAVTQEQVQVAYQTHLQRYVFPERRVSAHVLARLPRDGEVAPELEQRAKAFARSAVRTLTEAQDMDAELARLKGLRGDGFQVVVQDVPPSPRDGRLVGEYLDALFSLSRPGVVPSPVRTLFGWHAIVLTEILPVSERSLQEVSEELEAELLLPIRGEHHEETVEGLAGGTAVKFHPDVAERLATLEDN